MRVNLRRLLLGLLLPIAAQPFALRSQSATTSTTTTTVLGGVRPDCIARVIDLRKSPIDRRQNRFPIVLLKATQTTENEEPRKADVAAADLEQDGNDSLDDPKAATGTVNERLLAELQQASDKEKFGSRSDSRLVRLGGSEKTDEERQAAMDKARDLNGVNPVVALTGSAFAICCAYGLWLLTQYLATYFSMHPVDTDVYFIQRVASVFRNVVMGIVSLASGFFGVTGLGIFLLGVRVAYGVTTGELDPTPIKKNSVTKKEGDIDFGSAFELMTGKNKKRGQR